MRKILYLPIDIKSREMDARLLHAVVALDAGWQVITGSKTLINRALWRMPRGVYLFSTLAEGRKLIARCLRHMGFATQGWDEEGLIYGERDLYLEERVSATTLSLLDQIFAWGREHARDLSGPARAAGKTVDIAGNPRIDLLRPKLRCLYREETERIRRRHGDFILITTNLSWANPHVTPKEQEELHDGQDDPARHRAGARSYLSYQERMLAAFKSLIPGLARAFPTMKIILRPHPVESLEMWENHLASCPNVRIIRKGAVIPWILAGRMLIHSNSTTGLEARLLGCCPVAYVPFTSPRHESPLPNGVSLIARTEQKLIDITRKLLSGQEPDTSGQADFLNRYIHMHDGLAAEYFVMRAEEILERNSNPFRSIPIRTYLCFRHLTKLLRHNHPRDIHRKNIFPDTSEDEILERSRSLASCIDARCKNRIRVRNMGRNIFSLTLDGEE